MFPLFMFLAIFQVAPVTTQNAVFILLGGIVAAEMVKYALKTVFTPKPNPELRIEKEVSPALQLEMRRAMKETVDLTIVPILGMQTEILRAMKEAIVELAAIERNR